MILLVRGRVDGIVPWMARTPHPSNVRFLLFRLLSITMTVSRVSGGCLLAAGRTGEGVDSPVRCLLRAIRLQWSMLLFGSGRRPLCPYHPSRTHPHYSHHIPYCLTAGPRSFLTLQIYVPDSHRESIVTLVKQEKLKMKFIPY